MEVTQPAVDPKLATMCEAFMPHIQGQGTHGPYLLQAVLRTSGPILELGVGQHSTPALHLVTQLTGRRVYSYETTEQWVRHYQGLRSRLHSIECVKNYDEVPCQAHAWDVAFVDQAPSAERGRILPRLTHVPLVVCHDSEDPAYGYESAFKLFHYVRTFTKWSPWTTIVSNSNDVTCWNDL